MPYDIFISYAWTDEKTRTFARCLASHLHLIGFNVGIDIKADYGSSLSGFMNEIVESKHVLMIADKSYVYRANTMPESGVGIENALLRKAFPEKEPGWLSVAFVNQKELPEWLGPHNPKGFSFNLENDFQYGSLQIEDLWRWASDLPADKTNAISPSVIRQRLARIERIDNLRDPSNWANPSIEGSIHFEYKKSPSKSFKLGYGEYFFVFSCSDRNHESIYLYKDPVHSVGILPNNLSYMEISAEDAAKFLTPGRTVTLRPDQQFVIQNSKGVICVGKMDSISNFSEPFTEADSHVDFSYKILVGE